MIYLGVGSWGGGAKFDSFSLAFAGWDFDEGKTKSVILMESKESFKIQKVSAIIWEQF